MPSPANDPVGAKQSNERQLRALVASATNPRHDLRTLFFGEDIRHSGTTLDQKALERRFR
jgi:hypothetical protein